MEDFKRIVLSLFMLSLILLSGDSPMDELATRQLDAGLKRALTSYATARSLNAAISVAQGTQVAIAPAGIGITLAPGEILDPVNDLVEQFSQLMLIATMSLGIQKVLMIMGTHWLISLLLGSLAMLCLLFLWYRHAVPASLSRLLLLIVALRLGLPVVTIATDALFQNFLAAEYVASQKFITDGSGQVHALIAPAMTPPDPQWLQDKLQSKLAPEINVSTHLAALLKSTEQWPEQIMRLMVIFLLQVMILPLALLWGFVAIIRGILGLPSAAGPAPNPPK